MRLSILAIMLIAGSSYVAASWVDSLPIISQVKSTVLLIAGDKEGAAKVQENFLNQAPLVSQVKSLVLVLANDPEGALQTQKQFLDEFVEPLADNLPVVGHVKGVIHILAGDEERGIQVLEGATSNTAAVAGGIFGGPLGAVGAHTISDTLLTGLNSAVKGKFSPQGIVEYGSQINNASTGDHFDMVFGLATEFYGGKKVVRKKGFKTGKPATGKPKFGSGNENPAIKQLMNDDGSLNVPVFESYDEPPLKKSLLYKESAQRILVKARKATQLSDQIAAKLELFDFRDVNDVRGSKNCYYCTLAALRNVKVSEIPTLLKLPKLPDETITLGVIHSLFKEGGFPNTIVQTFERNAFYDYLKTQITDKRVYHFAIAEQYDNFFNFREGHVIYARAWKNSENKVILLTTDFQKPPHDNNRFRIGLGNNVQIVNVLYDPTMGLFGAAIEQGRLLPEFK